jgi:hypothetical protein
MSPKIASIIVLSNARFQIQDLESREVFYIRQIPLPAATENFCLGCGCILYKETVNIYFFS